MFCPNVIDISHHNSTSDLEQAHVFGVRGIVHKATQGLKFVDRLYAPRRGAALQSRLLWGAYHFGEGGDPAGQAKHFLDVVAPSATTLLALDLEKNLNGPTMSISEARVFIETVEREINRDVVLYAGYWTLHDQMGADADYLTRRRLWLAAYSDHPRIPAGWSNPWLWQFSGDGVNAHGVTVPGVSNPVDLDTYAGTDAQLSAEWADGPSSAPAAARAAQTESERQRVVALQSWLAARGFAPGRVDGVLGPQTVKAVQRWAGFTGGDVDGLTGPMTRPEIEKVMKESEG